MFNPAAPAAGVPVAGATGLNREKELVVKLNRTQLAGMLVLLALVLLATLLRYWKVLVP